ncbi:MAG TPA: O-antigen ligase family protein [Lutibacter sp.]|nr:O-antigen ligase family protein [Lutibacter sp.]
MKKKRTMSWKNFFAQLIMWMIATQIIFPLSINIHFANLFIYLLVITYSIYFVVQKKNSLSSNYFVNLYLWFSVVSIASIIWSIDPSFTIPIVIRVVTTGIVLFIIYNTVKQFKIEMYILYGVMIGALVNYMIALNILDYITPFTNGLRFTGTLARSNDVAIAMIIAIFSAIIISHETTSQYARKIVMLSIPLSLYVIFLTVSKKGILFGGALVLAYFIKEVKNIKRFIAIMVSTIIVLFILFKQNIETIMYKIERLSQRADEFESAIQGTTQSGSTGERIFFLQEGLEFFANNPILGTGLNTFMVMDKTQHYSHNNYIEILVGTGLVGLFVFYAIYFVMFRKLSRLNKSNNIKLLLFLTIFIFLFMDMTLVSYSYKLIIFTLLFISIYIDQQYKNQYK